MPRSLLAAFRSADGRSIARALAALILIGTVLSGFTTGAAASASFDHCITTPSHDPGLPAGHDGTTCCPGVIGAAPFLPPPADTLLGRRCLPKTAEIPPLREVWIPLIRIAPGDGPRGPPASA